MDNEGTPDGTPSLSIEVMFYLNYLFGLFLD